MHGIELSQIREIHDSLSTLLKSSAAEEAEIRQSVQFEFAKLEAELMAVESFYQERGCEAPELDSLMVRLLKLLESEALTVQREEIPVTGEILAKLLQVRGELASQAKRGPIEIGA